MAADRLREPLYTVAEAARYLGVPPSTLLTWAEGYERRHPDRSRVVSQGPLITSIEARPGQPRLPFIGLAEAMVTTAFRRCGLPMQRIRPAVKILKKQIGLEHALASRRLYTDGAEVLYDFAREYDDADIAGLVVVRSGQTIFHEIVRNYLKLITYSPADALASRLVLPITKNPVLTVDPTRGFGKPIFMRGHAPVESVLDRLKAGEPLSSVASDFEVPEEDLRDAATAFAAAA